MPTFFALTAAADLATWDRIMGRTFWTMGMRPSDTFAGLGNLAMFVGGMPAVTAASSIGACALPVGATAGTERTLELVQALGTTIMGATPSFAGRRTPTTPWPARWRRRSSAGSTSPPRSG